MAQRMTWHVLPAGDDGWRVERENTERAASRHELKADAINKAKELAKKRSLGQVIVHKQDGTIQEKFTYSRDPVRSKG